MPVRAPSQLISATMWAAGLRFPSGFLLHARLDKFSITEFPDICREFCDGSRTDDSNGNYFVSAYKLFNWRFATKFNVCCDSD